jgi:hypothetical protein
MSYSMHLCLALATLPSTTAARSAGESPLDDVLPAALQRLRQLVQDFLGQAVGPQATFHFEQQLQQELTDLGRRIVQWTFNHVEPAIEALPTHVHFEASPYTRLQRKTPQNIATRFGTIRWWRAGYRPTQKTGDPTIFPAAQHLGIVQAATPALAERVAFYQAQAGASQQRTLQCLRAVHQVRWGVKKLRQVTAALASALDEQRQSVQAEQVLGWLQQASASPGGHKPLLSVGRDGITLGLRVPGFDIWEVASTATVTVLDRRGQRLGTVYLAYAPQAGQATMSQQLTQLLREILERWPGPLPRLCYVTDAGDNETTYYAKVLRRMRHPRTQERLTWIRVLDYYHASERLWVMAEALQLGAKRYTWVRKMQKLLLQPDGVRRVLYSAAALRSQRGLRGQRVEQFRKAYNYIRERRRFMHYGEYRRQGVPLGSGVTEAACKTVYTQRLKLSGMRWKLPGAQTILNLRVVLLSGVWDQAYERVLQTLEEVQVRTYGSSCQKQLGNAA